jgi:DNA-binding IclR family transcriptional regulator
MTHPVPHSVDDIPASRVKVPNSVLGKTYSILSSFDNVRETLRLADLSAITGISKASVYRLAQELVTLGFLERVSDGYRLGFQAFILGQRAAGSGLLRAIARPVVADLYAATGATIHVATLERGRTFYVEKVTGTRGVHSLSHVGARLPLTCTATGKVLLAFSHERENIVDQLSADGLERLTQLSPASIHQLRRELDQAVARRFATEREETLAGYKSIAVPITALGSTVAAMSATVPVQRHDEQVLLQHLWAAAATIGHGLEARCAGRQSCDSRRHHSMNPLSAHARAV